jgi:hypothetical protein
MDDAERATFDFDAEVHRALRPGAWQRQSCCPILILSLMGLDVESMTSRHGLVGLASAGDTGAA